MRQDFDYRNAPELIRVENLHKDFGSLKVLSGITETIRKGEALINESADLMRRNHPRGELYYQAILSESVHIPDGYVKVRQSRDSCTKPQKMKFLFSSLLFRR